MSIKSSLLICFVSITLMSCSNSTEQQKNASENLISKEMLPAVADRVKSSVWNDPKLSQKINEKLFKNDDKENEACYRKAFVDHDFYPEFYTKAEKYLIENLTKSEVSFLNDFFASETYFKANFKNNNFSFATASGSISIPKPTLSETQKQEVEDFYKSDTWLKVQSLIQDKGKNSLYKDYEKIVIKAMNSCDSKFNKFINTIFGSDKSDQ